MFVWMDFKQSSILYSVFYLTVDCAYGMEGISDFVSLFIVGFGQHESGGADGVSQLSALPLVLGQEHFAGYTYPLTILLVSLFGRDIHASNITDEFTQLVQRIAFRRVYNTEYKHRVTLDAVFFSIGAVFFYIYTLIVEDVIVLHRIATYKHYFAVAEIDSDAINFNFLRNIADDALTGWAIFVDFPGLGDGKSMYTAP